MSDDENVNDDEDEMLFVRGASPIRKDMQENNSPRHANEHETFDSNSDYEERPNVNRHRENDTKRCEYKGRWRWRYNNKSAYTFIYFLRFILIYFLHLHKSCFVL